MRTIWGAAGLGIDASGGLWHEMTASGAIPAAGVSAQGSTGAGNGY